MLIIGASLWYTNHLVKSIADQEVKQVKMWAAAMEQHAVMMSSTEEFFKKVSEQEQLRVDLLANAYRRVIDISSNDNTAVYLDIIRNNISIFPWWSPIQRTTFSSPATCHLLKKARKPLTRR